MLSHIELAEIITYLLYWEAMEINLTAIWQNITAPFYWLKAKVTGKSRPRRYAARPLSAAEKKIRFMKLLRLAAVLALLGVVVAVILFFVVYALVAKDLPKPGQIVRHDGYSTKIFDRKGKLLYDLYEDEQREPVSSEQIAPILKQATVSIEDKDFYNHGGFDFLTPFRIVYNYIFRGGRVVGGSTLTQQLVKMVLLSNERTVIRKFKEFVLAIEIERSFSKDQILVMYLNEAPYGGNSAGVGAASKMYFGKPASDLNLVEAAVMAGLPQSPSRYSPFADRRSSDGVPLWKVRAQGVLNSMYQNKYITKDQLAQAVKDLDTLQFQTPQSQIVAPHFVFYVRDQLEKQFGQDAVSKGLQVTTTLDLDVQQKAQQIVKDEIGKVKNINISNGAAMVLNPQTGEILSMVGSADYNDKTIDGQFNVAVDGLRQPGSSIKPITYLGMFRKGYTPSSMLVDAPTTFQQNDKIDPYTPVNYDGKFRGPVNLRNSIGNSLNIPAVKSLAIVGIPDFLQMAYDMGFPTLEPSSANLRRFGLALTLGGGEVHLIDTVSAYSAFANGGTKVEPVSILKVTDVKNNTLYEFHPVVGKRVMTPEEAFLINSVLSDNNARAMEFGLNSLFNTGKPIAVKSGTTNDKKDNWAVGWSQNFMVGVWVGNSNNTAMKSVASGVTGASPIWRQIVNGLIADGYKAPDWNIPSGIDQVDVDNISGYPQHDGYASHKEYVIHGTLPNLPDAVHAKLRVCKGENKLATDAKIGAGDYEEKEFVVLKEEDPYSQDGKNRWQDGINSWVSSQNNDIYKYPTEYCGSTSDISVKVNAPNNQQKLDGEDVNIEGSASSGDGIDKLELWVDGAVKESVNSNSYKQTVHLPAGQHQIYFKAYAHNGQTAQSGTVNIGTGGQDWQKPNPSPTPTPSPTPSPSPSPILPLPSPSP